MKTLSFLTLSQITFFNALNSTKFKNRVLSRANTMGMDGAFYFTIGELQSELNNLSFDELTDEQMDDVLDALIFEIPELEF